MIVRVVEDNDDLAHLIALFAEGWPNVRLESCTAHFGKLLDVKQWKGVDVALLDYHLGEPITGLEICRWLAESCPYVRRVILTAQVLEGSDLWAEMSQSAHAVLTKPVTSSELAAAIGAVGG